MSNEIVPFLNGQTIPDFLGAQIREFLNQKAFMWDLNAAINSDVLNATALADVTAVIAYIQNPANVNYTIPAYVPPGP